jgi:hypothetical protein
MMEPQTYLAPDWAVDLLPRVLPAGWREHNDPRAGLWFSSGDGLRVIMTAAVERDGKRWIHVSFSRPNRLPSWDDLRKVKDVFLGNDRLAVQIQPRKKDYVNHHPYTLHLWSCLDGDPVPDFRRDGMI